MHRAATSTDIFNRILPFVWEFSVFFWLLFNFSVFWMPRSHIFRNITIQNPYANKCDVLFFVYFQRQCQVYKTIAEVMVWLEAAATVIIEYRAIATP